MTLGKRLRAPGLESIFQYSILKLDLLPRKACSKRSDSGNGAKGSEHGKTARGGARGVMGNDVETPNALELIILFSLAKS